MADNNKVEFGLSNLYVGTYTVAAGGTVTLGTPFHQASNPILTTSMQTISSIGAVILITALLVASRSRNSTPTLRHSSSAIRRLQAAESHRSKTRQSQTYSSHFRPKATPRLDALSCITYPSARSRANSRPSRKAKNPLRNPSTSQSRATTVLVS